MMTRTPSVEEQQARDQQIRHNTDVLLNVWKQRWEEKRDSLALMRTIWQCAKYGYPAPDWAIDAMGDAIARIGRRAVTSWDEALGKPRKGEKHDAAKQRQKLEFDVWLRVHYLRTFRPKPKDIFQTVAKDLKIGEATVKRYFEEIEAAMPRSEGSSNDPR